MNLVSFIYYNLCCKSVLQSIDTCTINYSATTTLYSIFSKSHKKAQICVDYGKYNLSVKLRMRTTTR